MFVVVAKLCLLALFFDKCSADVKDQYYPYYHLAPPHGWMNDPNGFIVFRNEYHLFYQYNPNSSQGPGIAHWGHAKSSDLFHWKHLPIAMYPDQDYDKGGVFSGSAIIDLNNTMLVLYTGNVNHPGQDPDHNNREALAYSIDGVKFYKYPDNPIIMADEYQPNIRDPKVWKDRDTYYMVLGNSFDKNTRGRVLLFSSKNLINWQVESVLEESDGALGYMWECPDFFEINGKWVLLFSPQGVAPQGDNYKNLYQVGYFVGDFDYQTRLFTVTSEFKELDHGHDFYATQTTLDKSGRRTVVAWFDMWEEMYPERNDGWTGHMTIPRNLRLTPDQRLIQTPVKEIRNIRGDPLFSGQANGGTWVQISNNAGEVQITAPRLKDFELIIEGGDATVRITYDYALGRVTLDRGGNDGVRRTRWRPKGKLRMQVFIDRSSIELFCGEGEVTFSSRFFPTSDVRVKIGDNSYAENLQMYLLKHTVPAPQ